MRLAAPILAAAILLGSSAAPAGAAALALPPTGWSQGASLPASFVPRWGAAVAYFPPTDQVILFGGSPTAGTAWYGDTWAFSNATQTWSQLSPAASPPARSGAAMAYDPTIGKLVLFGGATSGWPNLNDTWTFDGTTWAQVDTSGCASAPPAPRAGARMVFDPDLAGGTGEMVLMGGTGAAPYNDVWAFDGTCWTSGPATPSSVPARAYFGMAYDPTHHLILIGGGDGSTDTWLFRPTASAAKMWKPGPAFPTQIGGRERFQLAYWPDQNAMALFSGIGSKAPNSALWILQSTGWSQVSTTNPPAARVDAGFVWNPTLDSLLLVGGVSQASSGTVGFSDTWFYRQPAASPPATRPYPSSTPLPAVPLGSTHATLLRPATSASGFGLITANGGQFWLNGQPVVLHGAMPDLQSSLTGYQQMAADGVTFVRLRYYWAYLEPNPPTYDSSTGQWVHQYDQTYMSEIIQNIQWAEQAGLYVLLCDFGRQNAQFPFGEPNWIFGGPAEGYPQIYNSKGVDYFPATHQSFLQEEGDFWSDANRQTFRSDMLDYVASQVMSYPNILGYEIKNEPAWGYLSSTPATTQQILDVQLAIAQKLRTVDPSHIIFFTTRGPIADGVRQADLSGWVALGNVAFDVHDYFGARWGDGVAEGNPTSASYEQVPQVLYNMTVFYMQPTPTIPPYDGRTDCHIRWLQYVESGLATTGIPVFVGEIGVNWSDPGATQFWGTATSAVNDMGLTWTADWSVPWGFTNNGQPLPWTDLVIAALKS